MYFSSKEVVPTLSAFKDEQIANAHERVVVIANPRHTTQQQGETCAVGEDQPGRYGLYGSVGRLESEKYTCHMCDRRKKKKKERVRALSLTRWIYFSNKKKVGK